MGFVCKQSITLSGNEYHPGDAIPDGVILGNRARTLKRSGHIVEVSADSPEPAEGEVKIQIPVQTDGGEILEVALTEQEIRHVFTVMQLNAENASAEIQQIQSEDELIVIHAADSRKSVQKAAKEQASLLLSNQE